MPTAALPRISVRADVGIGPYGRFRSPNLDLMSLYESIHTKQSPAADESAAGLRLFVVGRSDDRLFF